MLRITDARTGEPVDAAPARRGLTRVVAHVTGHDTTALRVLLLADVLVRALELGGTPVWALLGGERRQPDLRATAAALGIRPFEDGGDTGAGLGAAQVIHVVGESDAGLPGRGPGAGSGSRAEGGSGPLTAAGSDTARVADGRRASGGAHAADPEGAADRAPAFDTARSADTAPASSSAGAASHALADVHFAVAPVTSVAPVAPVPSAGPADAGMPGGAAPAVVRLGLLSRPRSEPVPLDADALRDAEDTLVRWRRAVAGWAREPSRAIPEEVRGELRAAWEDDLDVLGVLRVLRRVETSDLPAGARFETFAYADRLLGLELTRDVGSPA
ncbi:hypothetical protein [Streptomyces cellulosae]|uniref:hypothetical protein n=1 Tax=Streptomyces cellulosae TaxID=1968 RepID=UPI0004C54C0B|nr:hypothetical protein [Streptomyces cellulosae]